MFLKWELYQTADVLFASTNGNGQRRGLTAEVIFGTGGSSDRGDKAGKCRPFKGTYLLCLTLLQGNSGVVVLLIYLPTAQTAWHEVKSMSAGPGQEGRLTETYCKCQP